MEIEIWKQIAELSHVTVECLRKDSKSPERFRWGAEAFGELEQSIDETGNFSNEDMRGRIDYVYYVTVLSKP